MKPSEETDMHFEYRIATAEDLEQLWTYNIVSNPDDPRWGRWKDEYVAYNQRGQAITFAVIANSEAVGEGTLILSPECKPVRNHPELADGQTVGNINALRIRKKYEGQGHISKMVRLLEQHAREIGLKKLTIGVEANETRNLGIYLHWGYDTLVHWETEEDTLVLYYEKTL